MGSYCWDQIKEEGVKCFKSILKLVPFFFCYDSDKIKVCITRKSRKSTLKYY